VPVIVWLMVLQTRPASVAAAVVFVVGALTDGLDGYLARRWDTSTRTGQWLDPLADKALVAAPVITLTIQGLFPVWAAVLILVREVGIALLRVVLGTRGRSMPATWPAKVKTVLQLTAITMYILPLGTWADGLKLAVLIVAVAFTVVTGVQYAVQATRGPRAPASPSETPDAERAS